MNQKCLLPTIFPSTYKSFNRIDFKDNDYLFRM